MKTLWLLLSLVLTACSTTSAGIIPMGNDVFTTSSRGDTGFSQMSEIKMQALQQATKHCASLGKAYQQTNTREVSAGFGTWPEYEIQFTCVEMKK